ncbi:hypothetical protein QYF36_022334 [Acer negundo]|nr:hypothetical protein QYF36_022334 [Acer negundo]
MGNTKSSNSRFSTKVLSFNKDKEVNMNEVVQYIRNSGFASYVSIITLDQEKQMVTENGKFDSDAETYKMLVNRLSTEFGTGVTTVGATD